MIQLAAQAVGKAADRELGRAIGCLQRDSTIGQRRSHLNDGSTVVRPHPLQRREGPVHISQVGDLGRPLELGGGDGVNRGEDRGHGGVDPDVDAPEPRLHRGRGALHRVGIGDIGRSRERLPPARSISATASLSPAWPRAISPTLQPLAAKATAAARPTPRAGTGDDDYSAHCRCLVGRYHGPNGRIAPTIPRTAFLNPYQRMG